MLLLPILALLHTQYEEPTTVAFVARYYSSTSKKTHYQGYVIDIATKKVTKVTNDEVDYDSVSWVGKNRLVFGVVGGTKGTRLFTMKYPGGKMTPVAGATDFEIAAGRNSSVPGEVNLGNNRTIGTETGQILTKPPTPLPWERLDKLEGAESVFPGYAGRIELKDDKLNWTNSDGSSPLDISEEAGTPQKFIRDTGTQTLYVLFWDHDSTTGVNRQLGRVDPTEHKISILGGSFYDFDFNPRRDFVAGCKPKELTEFHLAQVWTAPLLFMSLKTGETTTAVGGFVHVQSVSVRPQP